MAKPLAAETLRGTTNSWFLIINDLRLTKNLTFVNQVHERTYQVLHQQRLLRDEMTLMYDLNKPINLSLGFYINEQEPPTENPLFIRNAQILYQQAILRWDLSPSTTVFHRLRQEEWFRKNPNLLPLFRYQMRYMINLNQVLLPFKKGDSWLFARVFDEMFMNQDSHLQPEVITQNRIYAGLGYRVNKSMNIQLGYLHQKLRLASQHYLVYPGLWLTLYKGFNTDFA